MSIFRSCRPSTAFPAVVAFWFIVFLVTLPNIQGETLAFLKIDGIKDGEADSFWTGSDGWTEVSSLNVGLQNEVIFGRDSVPTVGKTRFSELQLVKKIDIISPQLFSQVATGLHYPEAVLMVRQVGGLGRNSPYYLAVLKNVFVAGINWKASRVSDSSYESVTFAYGSIQWTYVRQDSNHDLSIAVTVNWDQIKNQGGSGPMPGATFPPELSYPARVQVVTNGFQQVPPVTGPDDFFSIASITIQDRGGYIGGADVDPLTGVVTLTNAAPLGGPYPLKVRMTDVTGLIVESVINITVSPSQSLPIAGSDRVYRLLASPLRIPISQLLQNDSAGASFAGLPSNQSSLGGQVMVSGPDLVYTPPSPDPGVDDSFSYQIRDPVGQPANGNVTVGVGGSNGQPIGNLVIQRSDSTIQFQLMGSAGQPYSLQSADNLLGPWTDLDAAQIADSAGIVRWADSEVPGTRFYRARQ